MAIYGDGVFEDDEIQADVPVVEQTEEDKLRQMGAELGLFDKEDPGDVEAIPVEEVVEPVEAVTPPESYSFKTESDFQEAALKALETKLGVPIAAVVEMLEDFGGYRNQNLIEQQKQPLKSEWVTSLTTVTTR